MSWAIIAAFARKNWLPIAIVVLAVVVLGMVWGMGASHEVAKQQARELDVRAHVGDANTNAAAARVEDAVRTEQQGVELNAAIQAVDNPDRLRAQRGCVILRQQGRDTSRIPACGGPAGRDGAGLP